MTTCAGKAEPLPRRTERITWLRFLKGRGAAALPCASDPRIEFAQIVGDALGELVFQQARGNGDGIGHTAAVALPWLFTTTPLRPRKTAPL